VAFGVAPGTAWSIGGTAKGRMSLQRIGSQVYGVYWDDIRIVPGSFDRPGVTDPSYANYAPGGSGVEFPVLTFAKNQYATAAVQIPHSYKEGTDLYCHIHWTPRDRGAAENANTVGWKVDYSAASIGGTFPTAQQLDLSDACSGVDHKHEITEDVAISGAGLTLSSMVLLKISRVDTGTDDTWNGSNAAQLPAFLELDLHFQIDAPGSRQIRTK